MEENSGMKYWPPVREPWHKKLPPVFYYVIGLILCFLIGYIDGYETGKDHVCNYIIGNIGDTCYGKNDLQTAYDDGWEEAVNTIIGDAPNDVLFYADHAINLYDYTYPMYSPDYIEGLYIGDE